MNDDERRQELLRKLGISLDSPVTDAEFFERQRKASDAQAHKVALEIIAESNQRWRRRRSFRKR